MIENLFVIGNGFDIGHGMKTSYTNFKKWLEDEYFCRSGVSYVYLPWADGDEVVSLKDVASLLYYCVENASGGNWADFESALGMIQWDYFFEYVDDFVGRHGEIDLWKTAYNREDFTNILSIYSSNISDLFNFWINSIETYDNVIKNPFFTDYIKKSSFYLTFNYTKTLEEVYLISENRVHHIHGMQGDKIIFGHGCDYKDLNIKYNFGFENIENIHNMLKKPTKEIIHNTDVFKKIRSYNIVNVYSWGFSFSNVDQCYIREICKSLDTNGVTWYIHDYDSICYDRFRSILLTCGFKGQIKTFNA